MWLSVDDEHVPVGFVDAEIYDRYAHWDPADMSRQAVSDVVETASMGFAVVVDPARRSRGFGKATIRAAIEHPDVKNVCLFFGGVEADNAIAIACLQAVGLHRRSASPDFEGMLQYSLER